MPYNNVPDDKQDAMESCVQGVLADHSGEEGFTKENAIKICYTRIVGSADVVVESADVHFEIVTDPAEVNMVLGQDFEPGELLRWKNAELARAEVNANMDELSNDNIGSLADTLPLMPLTDEHDETIVGLFTAASVAAVPDKPDTMRLLTDGIMYARRFPEVADDIRSGAKRLSVEAFADTAMCSICGGEFPNAREYCEHLKNRHSSGASRQFRSMRAVGGGVVRRPAGSMAGFDKRHVYMVASHEEVTTARGEGKGVGGEPQGDGGATTCVCPKCEATSKHDKGAPCSEQTCPKCGAAMTGKNRAEGGTVDIEQIQNQLTQALADLEAMRQERDGVVEERDGFSARITELEASVNTLTAELEQVKEEREQVQADLVWKERSGVLASVFEEEELERQKPVIMAMSDEAVQLFVKAAKATSDPPPNTLTANLGEDDDGTVVVSLA